MRKALLLNVLDPSIGGVLIRGEKGTAKTTAVRGIASGVLDTEGGYTKSLLVYSTPGRAPEIARALGAKYITLGRGKQLRLQLTVSPPHDGLPVRGINV